MQTVLNGVRILLGELQLIGSVQFGFKFDGLDGGSAEPQRIDANAVLSARHRLDLKRAGQGIGVVLERDNALDRGGVRVHRNDAASDEAGGIRKCAHSVPTW